MDKNGFNPMRYACKTSGCYNLKHRPKIELFSKCFDGRIAMSDIDAAVEVNWNFLFLEWKSHNGPLPAGQRILLERMTYATLQFQAIIVVGNAETMRIEEIARLTLGKMDAFTSCDLDGLLSMIQGWNDWAKENPCGKPFFRNPGTIGAA